VAEGIVMTAGSSTVQIAKPQAHMRKSSEVTKRTPSDPGEEIQMEDKIDVIRRLVAACYSADEAAMREIIGPDFLAHGSGGGTGNADGWVSLAKQMAAGTPDGVTEIDDIFGSGDKVAVRLTSRGTHNGELHGVPPTNKELATGANEIYRFEGDRVVECWGQYDMSQLFAK